MKISKASAKRIGDKLGINWDIISVETMQLGMEIELEHGYINMRTNVTDNDLTKTAKIALAHLAEYPDYYERLEKMEQQAEKYWHNKKKPNIFLKDVK
jgi:hypothetical protein